jgi:hypothetical protein
MPRSGLSSGVSDSGGLKALMAGIGSGRQFVSVKDQMKLMSHQAELQDQLNANAQTYTNQGKTREAELGDVRATRDTARMTFGREHQADLFTRFRGANPEVTDYDMDAKGGFRTKMGAMAFPSGDVKPFGGDDTPRNTVKKIQSRVDSGELSPAEAANTYRNYAAKVGRDKADDWAGKPPAPIREGVEYVAGVGSSRQFTTDSAGTTTAPTASSTPKRTRTRKAGASSGTASQTKPTSTTGTTTPIK